MTRRQGFLMLPLALLFSFVSEFALFRAPGLALVSTVLAAFFGVGFFVLGVLGRPDLAGICLIVTVVGAFSLQRACVHARVDPFQERVREYVFEPRRVPTYEPVPARAKFVVVDKKSASIEPRTFVLPRDIRPESPQDVHTVAWLERDRDVVFHYTDGSPAIQHVWHLTLVDLATKSVLFQGTFKGSRPPEVVYAGRPQEGSLPEDQVFDFLARYPRK
jgi:hypothetical protein